MTPRISLRPTGPIAVLMALVAAVLVLISVTHLSFKNGADTTLSVTTNVHHHSVPDAVPSVRTGPLPTASAVAHRPSVPMSGRRAAAASLGPGTEFHHPGGSPDLPAVVNRGWYRPARLIDLPIDASAGVIATTVRVAHRGRAPPTSGFI